MNLSLHDLFSFALMLLVQWFGSGMANLRSMALWESMRGEVMAADGVERTGEEKGEGWME